MRLKPKRPNPKNIRNIHPEIINIVRTSKVEKTFLNLFLKNFISSPPIFILHAYSIINERYYKFKKDELHLVHPQKFTVLHFYIK